MAVALHCSGDGSGVTDWISNVTRITPVSGEDPRPWLTPIASGNDRLLTFLHEATHNWCFNSAVVHAQLYVAGRAELNAMAYLMLQDEPDPAQRAARGKASPTLMLQLLGQAVRALVGDPRPRLGGTVRTVRDQLGLHIHDDVIRLEVVSELFRPLAEGLALFAEYDAVSRFSSRAWSPLPLAVAWNFGGPERFAAQGERGFIEPFSTTMIASQILYDARLSEWAVTTKASLLRAPFRSTGGGYLPGYLAVKSMWRNLFRQDPRLYGESDMVLTYVRNFFFEDLDLAAELLAPPINNCVLSTNRLLGRFNARTSEFFEATPADLTAFEDALDSDGPVEGAGMLRTPGQHHEARRLIQERIDDFRSSPAARISDFALHHAVDSLNSLMGLRQFVTIMSVAVDVDERGTVTWQGHEVLTVDPDDLIHPGTGAHTLDILLGMSGQQALSRVAAISRGEDLHSVTVVLGSPEQKQALRDSLATSFASREQRESMARNLQFTADAIVAEDWGLRMNRDHVREHLRSVVDKLYHDIALRYSSGYDAMDRCSELMADHGLRPLLGSTETLRQVALLGLAASMNSYRDELEKQFQRRGLDLPALLTTLNQRWEKHGFPPRVHESPGKREVLVPFL
jgi:hypothetical protein